MDKILDAQMVLLAVKEMTLDEFLKFRAEILAGSSSVELTEYIDMLQVYWSDLHEDCSEH